MTWQAELLPAYAIWFVGTVSVAWLVHLIGRTVVREHRGDHIAAVRIRRAVNRGRAGYVASLTTPSGRHAETSSTAFKEI
jgi:hypothetical protein